MTENQLLEIEERLEGTYAKPNPISADVAFIAKHAMIDVPLLVEALNAAFNRIEALETELLKHTNKAERPKADDEW